MNGTKRRSWSPAALLGINLLLIILLCASVALYGTSKENGTRVRNSFLVKTANPSLFALEPNAIPDDFIRETRPAPEYLKAIVGPMLTAANRSGASDFAQSLILARHLIENKSKGKAIQGSVAEAYSLIRTEGRGYCADYSQVFTALALTAGIPVREWGLGFDGFGRGHAFNEIFDSDLNAWVFIDSFHSLYVVDRLTRIPLSASEFQRRLIDDANMRSYEFVPIVPGKYRFKTTEEANSYYASTAQNFYLFWGNNVFSYDTQPIVRVLASLSRSLEILGAIIVGTHPPIRVLPLPGNTENLRRLRQISIWLQAAFIVFSLLVAALIYQLVYFRKRQRRWSQSEFGNQASN